MVHTRVRCSYAKCCRESVHAAAKENCPRLTVEHHQQGQQPPVHRMSACRQLTPSHLPLSLVAARFFVRNSKRMVTTTKSPTKHPRWNESFELPVHVPEHQELVSSLHNHSWETSTCLLPSAYRCIPAVEAAACHHCCCRFSLINLHPLTFCAAHGTVRLRLGLRK